MNEPPTSKSPIEPVIISLTSRKTDINIMIASEIIAKWAPDTR